MKLFSSGEIGRDGWAINGRFLTQPMTGVQRYAIEIVKALDQIIADQRGIAASLNTRLVLPPGVAVKPHLLAIGVDETSLGSGHAWDQLVLPFFGRSGVLSLGNFGPILARRQIVCIHDANTFIQTDSYSRSFGVAYRTLLPLLGRCASKVATVSQFSADMLVKYEICRPEKIFIAPNGHEHALRWNPLAAENEVFKTLKRPYVLLLGSRAKHKNVQIVLDQSQALDEAGIDIVVVGATLAIFSADMQILKRPNIHYAGYIGDDDLAALYEGALCLVFPSTTEGFGIPPLEAMARGCPVISSNAASLMEVGGDAVAYVDPDDREGWRHAIVGLAGNPGLRKSMAERGRKRSALFSWKRSAQLYLDQMLKLAK